MNMSLDLSVTVADAVGIAYSNLLTLNMYLKDIYVVLKDTLFRMSRPYMTMPF